MVGESSGGVAWPVSAGLYAQNQCLAVESGFKTVQRVGMADRFTDNGEIIGAPSGHGCEHGFDRLKGFMAPNDFPACVFVHDQNLMQLGRFSK